MFRCSLGDATKLKSLACYVYPVTTTQFTQSIRWKRKPRWLPVAKSKLFRIPVRPVIPAEEKLELFQLHAHYKTQMRAVKKFIREELAAETTSLENVNSEKSLLEESIDFKRCEEENNKWNAEVAVIRAQRLERAFAKREEDILNSMARKDLRIQKLKQDSEEKIRQFKEQSKSFITPETLDAAIEAAVNSTVDYNFAIDNDGNIYAGREGGIQSEEEEKAQATS